MGWAVAPLVSLAISTGAQLLLGLFKKSPKQEDPSLQLPKSDYGVGIPKIYGRVRLEGNKFFPQTKELMYEIRNERSSGGGGKGGGRSRTTNEKKVYGSIALLYCEGKTTLEKIIIQGEHIETNHPFYQQYCTWFDGTQDQVWSVVAQDEEPYKFIKYKNVAYLGIEKMPLDRYGNQIPSQISAVLVDGVFGAQPTLDKVVGDILTRAGIDGSLWDVTDLSQIILRDGVVIRQSGESYREAIESLMELYLFAPYQDNDGKIIFRRIRRGDSSIVSLNNRYFVENEDGGSYISEIKSDFELPTKLSIKFFNNSRVYEQDEVNVYLGNKSESENNVKSVSETLYTYPYEAEERAREILSYFYSLEKNSFKFKLPIYYYSQFNCLDVVTLPNGQTVQITKINIGADYTVEITATYYDSVQSNYNSTPDTAVTPPVLTDPPIPQIFILDAPVINNDLPGSLYCFATSGPATIEFSDNGGASWSYATNHLYASVIGECVDVIGSSVTVNLISGSGLESITQAEFDVDMGQNLCLIGRQMTDGYYEGEFIQFRDAVLVSANQYTLSTFKKGLNNTGNYQHVSGEKLFLFKGVGSYYSIIPGNASFLGLNLSFRTIVSDWQNLATTPTVAVTPSGNAYKPSAPFNLTAIKDEDGNVKLFWDYNAGFSPYNNSQESITYDIQVQGGRLLTSNSKNVLYLIADRTADLVTLPITVTIYAVSTVVGRGYGYTATVDPTLVANGIFGTGNGLEGITQIYSNYTVQESDNNKIIVGYTQNLAEYFVDFPSSLSNGFQCWVVNARGNNYACYFTIRGTNNITREEHNRIKAGDSRQFLHISNGDYLVLGINRIVYDYFGWNTSGTIPINGFLNVETVGLTLTFPTDAIEGDFIGIKTASNLDFASNPLILQASNYPIEGNNTFNITGANERYLFYFAGTQWIYLSRYVDQSSNFQQSLIAGTNIDLDYDNLANTTTINVTGLATVATSGSYNDLSDKPVISNLTVKDSEGTFTEIGIVDFGTQFDVVYTGEPQEVNVTIRSETIEDIIAEYIQPGTGLSKTYDDINNRLFLNPHQIVGGDNILVTYNNNLKIIEIDYVPSAELNPSYLLNRTNHTGTQPANTITGLASVATSGSYTDLSNRPSLGSAATRNAGTLANNVLLISEDNKLPILDGSNLINVGLGGSVANTDNFNNQPPSFYLDRTNHTGTQSVNTITGLGSSATKNAGTLANNVLLISEDNKLPVLDGSNLTNIISTVSNAANLGGEPPSYYLDRANHTGTQSAGTITGLATVATSGNYNDLSNRLVAGTLSGQVLLFSEDNKLPVLDGSNLTNIISTVSNATTLGGELPSYYLSRANHTGTQSHTTISGLGSAATRNAGTLTGQVLLLSEDNKLPIMDGSNLTNVLATVGDYNDLINKPTLGTAAQYNTGTGAGEILRFPVTNTLPALDGSNLYGINANNSDLLAGELPSYFLNRSNHLGLQPHTSISGLGNSATKNAGTSAGEVLLLNETNKLPVLDGSNLTNVVATSGNVLSFNGQSASFYLDRTNHTGTQSVTTITGLATVATSGSYTDLINTPSIPNNETIDDRVASLLVAGTGVALNYDDTANTLTISSSISTDTLPVSVSSTYTLQTSDNKKWIMANGTFTISMLGSPPNYYEAIIQNVGTGTITISGIANAVGTKLTTRWTACHVYFDGTSWTAVGALTT